MIQKRVFLTTGLLILVFSLILFIFPNKHLSLAVLITALTPTVYFFILVLKLIREPPGQRRKRIPISLGILSLCFLGLPFLLGLALFLLTPSTTSLFFSVLTTGLVLTISYDLLNIPLALYHKHLEEEDHEKSISYYPPVSIIVPAYNEEKCIERTIESLIEIDYPSKEIIVVDDGSTDKTYEIALRYVPKGVKVVHRSNGGKWAALNYGMLFAKGEIIITVDADSLISRRALMEVIRWFQDPTITAVCGNVKVLNRNNFLTKCQALEYITDINIAKRAFGIFGSTMVVPGVFGAFRRKVLEGTGFYDPDTLTEDFDTTIKALKSGGVVQTTSSATAYTEAPETLTDLYKQRLRWYRGTFQVMIKHRDLLVHPRFGSLSVIGYPYILLSMVFVPLCGLLAIFSGIFACLTGAALEFLQMLGLFVSLEVLFSILAIQLDNEDLKLALYAPFFMIGYRQLRDLIRFKSLIDVVFRRKLTWTKVQRMGRAAEMMKRATQEIDV